MFAKMDTELLLSPDAWPEQDELPNKDVVGMCRSPSSSCEELVASVVAADASGCLDVVRHRTFGIRCFGLFLCYPGQ